MRVCMNNREKKGRRGEGGVSERERDRQIDKTKKEKGGDYTYICATDWQVSNMNNLLFFYRNYR